MTKEYRAKVFKSGNSLALRLPKALGIEEGTEMIVREERGEFRFGYSFGYSTFSPSSGASRRPLPGRRRKSAPSSGS